MRNFCPEDIAHILGGKLLTNNKGHPVQIFASQLKDNPLQDSLYFLFNGCSNEDELLKQVKENKAAGVVIRENHKLNPSKWESQGVYIIELPHMTKPYMELSKIYRSQFSIPFIEVIGSSGKTTTKEMIGAILKERMPTLISPINYNSPRSVAYNIFSVRDTHKAAVLEVGMKKLGIMERSSSIVQPDIAVLTSIHRSHLVSLGSMENIIQAKSEILKYLSKSGTLIMNGEDINCNKFPIDRFEGEILRFGFSNRFDIYGADIKYKDFKTFFRAVGKDYEADCVINTVGRYNVSNALAAFLAGIKLGLTPFEISIGLSKFEPLNGRLKLHKGIYNILLIDDNFNANPDSTRLLIRELPSFAEGRPVVLVIGDMERPDERIEKYARKVHFMIGQQISEVKPRYVIAIGKWAVEYVNGALSKGFPRNNAIYFSTVNEAKEHVFDFVIPNSIVLFKASVYTKVKELIEPLKAD